MTLTPIEDLARLMIDRYRGHVVAGEIANALEAAIVDALRARTPYARSAEQLAHAVVDRYRDRLDRAEIDPDRLEAVIVDALAVHTATLKTALDESIKLQAHYAHLLNLHDGGRRQLFINADAWIARLQQTGTVTKG